jgi:hypothetical protein
MNIHELDSYNLGDAVKFNDKLNPRIWGADEKMRPEVREQLLKIADDFREFLGIDVELKDITVSGSNAAFTYTPHSDIDLHLVVDLPEADRNAVYRELFDAKKYAYNEQHDIRIGGYDVELYVQDANKKHHSQGIYSIVNDDWVSVPKRRRPDVDDISVKSKFEDLGHRIEAAIKSQDYEKISAMAEKIKDYRQAGLDAHGEFGPENLAFKILRTQGLIKKLYDARNAAKDELLSLDERKKKKKKKTRYGFGGYWYPGYAYAGQDHPAGTEGGDGGGDGGGESVKEDAGMTWDGVNPTTDMFTSEDATMTWDGVNPTTAMFTTETQDPTDEEILRDFVDFCVKELKIKHMPRVKLRRDPQWPAIHKTFGRYNDENKTLEVAWGQRHIMDVLRTVAHELTHKHQHEREGHRMGPDAGETGSPYENEANARAGVLMRDYGRLHPEYFTVGQAHDLEESASGYIPTKAQAKDPRFSMALTVDIKPGQVGKEANKLKLKTDRQGQPQIARANGLFEELYREFKQYKTDEDYSPDNPPGPESKPTMPKGTLRVDVSDVYDWYKLGQHISNMKGLGQHDFGKGPPSSIISFGDEDLEHKFIKDLEATGLDVTDIDPVDPKQPPGGKIKTDPTYNVDEVIQTPVPKGKDAEQYYRFILGKARMGRPLTRAEQDYVKMYQMYRQQKLAEGAADHVRMVMSRAADIMKQRGFRAVGQLSDQDLEKIARETDATPHDVAIILNIDHAHEQTVAEFAPGAQRDDRGPDEEEILRQYAAQWYNGDEDPRVEKLLATMGWEIGQNEDDAGGAFVIRHGDINGDSFISWTDAELSALNEISDELRRSYLGRAGQQVDRRQTRMAQVRDRLNKGYEIYHAEDPTRIVHRFEADTPQEARRYYERYDADYDSDVDYDLQLRRATGLEENLNELALRSTLPVTQIMNHRSKQIYNLKTQSGEYQIVLDISNKDDNFDDDPDYDGPTGYLLNIYFVGKTPDGSWTQWNTNVGEKQVAQIFATIAQLAVKIIKAHPEIDEIEIKGADPQRSRIYSRLMQQNIDSLLPGWKLGGEGLVREKPQQAVAEVIKMPPVNMVFSNENLVDWAYNDAEKKQARQLQSLKIDVPTRVYDMGDHLRVFVIDDQGPVLYLALEKYLDGFKTNAVQIHPRGQGKNLAFKVYQAVSDTFQRPLYSDQTHTDASRLGIWKKLIDKFPNRLVGYDQATREDLPLTATDQGPVVRGKEPIYVQKKKKDLAKPVTPQTRSRTRLLKFLPATAKQVVTENEELDEVNMSPKGFSLVTLYNVAKGGWPAEAKLLKSLPPAKKHRAKGIRAGFEAELIFRDTQGDDEDDYDMEPDYDMDERAYSIQQVIEFFSNDDWGYGLSDRQIRSLENELDEQYMTWRDEQMMEEFRNEAEDLVRKVIEDEEWDWDDAVRNQLDDMGLSNDEIEEAMRVGRTAGRFNSSKEQEAYAKENPGYQRYLEAYSAAESILDDLVEESVKEQDKYYDAALDDFRDNWSGDDDSFFSDVGMRWMSDIANNFGLDWPYMTGGGNSNNGSRSWDEIGNELQAVVGMPVKVSSNYHSTARKEGQWIIEPDGSLNPDDKSDEAGLEIVSPPMPLLMAIAKLKEVTDWANDPNGGNAYTNASTGLHMGVSLPRIRAEDDNDRAGIDYVKLILFMGDKYVLEKFGREANTYTASALEKFKQNIRGGRSDPAGVVKLLKHGLTELAYRELQKGVGTSKYTSAHIQNGYIEFRSPGGDWLAKADEEIGVLENTMLRFARAMQIAGDPAAERQEYAKKLYKLVTADNEQYADQLRLFSEYSAGTIDKEQLKKQWAEKTIGTEKKANQRWKLYQKSNGTWTPVPGGEWNGYTEDQVKNAVWSKYGREALDSGEYQLVNMGEQEWEVYDVKTGKTLEIVKGKSKGEVADSVFDKYANQGIGFNVRPYEDPAKLTPRAKLAKRIATKKLDYNYDIIDRRTVDLKVVDRFYATDDKDASETFDRWLKSKGLPSDEDAYGYRKGRQAADDQRDSVDIQRRLGIQDVDTDVAQNFNQPPDATDVPRNWEFVDRITGRVIHNMTNASYNQANAVQDNLESRYPNADIYLRSVAQNVAGDYSAYERNSDRIDAIRAQTRQPRQNYELVSDEDPDRVIHRMNDATADEVRAWIAQQEQGGMPAGFLRTRIVAEAIDPISGAGAVPPRNDPKGIGKKAVTPAEKVFKNPVKGQPYRSAIGQAISQRDLENMTQQIQVARRLGDSVMEMEDTPPEVLKALDQAAQKNGYKNWADVKANPRSPQAVMTVAKLANTIMRTTGPHHEKLFYRNKTDVDENFADGNSMSTKDMIAYLRQHHDTNLHQDYLDHINTFGKFVLKNIPVSTIKTELSGLDPAKVEKYKQMDFDKAPPIVMGDGYILDGYHRATAAKALGIPTIRGYVGIKGQQDMAENFADGKVKGKSRPGRVKRAGASCNGSVTDLRKRAKNASGEKAKMYHWCANMKSGRKK